ncbi:hypothetical protein TRFO_37593 [Tritrichomonas foetus]|uniref:Uncharacterized protein n=1 Tax=Tritrichomonas foetus TaxID=1144522 RepID=A0A1J4JAQ8_9EUKA|nr:hypothetical protein TRFO_37593 [Tritrichomonas foetus]|eukprot:OHS96262.1 hypothetical protein TRFO_37593 [Tritrichomonas foetus]
MFAYSTINYQNLLDKIQEGAIELSEVVENDGFTTALRNDSQVLISYLTQDHILRQITRYALTNEYEGTIDPYNYRRMQRHCINILTSSARNLQNFLLENEDYIVFLRSFPETESINFPILCANYTKIIDFLFSYSQGNFMTNDYTELADILIGHIDILSFQSLFVKLCCDFSNNFNLSYDLMKKLISSPKDFSKIYTLLKIVDDKPSLILFLNIPEILQPLYEIVVRTYGKDHTICVHTCSLLSIIIKSTAPNNLCYRYGTEYGDKINFLQPINYSSAAVLEIFPKYVGLFIDRFFSEDLPTQLNQSILEALKIMEFNELQIIAQKYNIFQKIMDNFPMYLKKKTNGHFFSVAQLFITKEVRCPEHLKIKWATFVKEQFKDHYRDIHIFYGGPTRQGAFFIRTEPVFNIPMSIESIDTNPGSQRHSSTHTPIKIEITAEISKDVDLDKRLMSKSLDQNTMSRIVKSSRFTIKKEPARRPDSDSSNDASNLI